MPARRLDDLDTAVPVGGDLLPLDYPGRMLQSSGLMRYGRLSLLEFLPKRRAGQARVLTSADGRIRRRHMNQVLMDENSAAIDSRAIVLAVGSNASPGVLQHKFLNARVSVVVPMALCTVDGLHAGFSAHVSKRGYIPAAPFAAAGQSEMQVSWLDDAQLAALDSSEPNYRRVLVDGTRYPLTILGSGERPRSYYLYLSRHGVLGEQVPLRLTSQQELYAILDEWGSDKTNVLPEAPEATVDRLADDKVQDQLRKNWETQESVLPDGIHVLADGGADLPYGDTRCAMPGDTANMLAARRSPNNLKRHGEQCIVMHPDDLAAAGLKAAGHAVVRSALDRSLPRVLASVVSSPTTAPGTVAMDQVVRNSLGIELQERVLVSPASVTRDSLVAMPLGRRRYIMVRVQPADIASVEQDACLIDPIGLTLLGIASGDSVVVEGLPDSGSVDVPRLRTAAYAAPDDVLDRRAELSGGAIGVRFPASSDALGVFPDLPWLFLDSSQRKALGIATARLAAIRLRASRRSVFFREARETLWVLLFALVGISSSLGNVTVEVIATSVLLAVVVLICFRVRQRLRTASVLRSRARLLP